MAAFRQHIAFSSLLGVGYSATLVSMGMDWAQSALAGVLCGFSGMLPDLDSPSGKPVREVFGLAAIIVPLLVAHRLQSAGLTSEQIVLSAAGLYLFIRFGLAWLLSKISVHRGMFHSLPAALIAGEIVFLAHTALPTRGRLFMAGGVVLGYLSHLVLDEIFSVDASGLVPQLKKSAGSAVKLFSSSVVASLLTWVALGLLSYEAGVDQGYWKPIHVQDLQALDRYLPRRQAAIPAEEVHPAARLR
jgi:membrane-bound metal-dependent hydrolase YbcI (DUF457 family)